MRYGVVSDVHANIQAWKAVLRDMKNQGVDVILCLGDVVGYGPNPAEVLDSCYEHVDYFILGNHDAVVGNRLDSSLFNDNAKYLIDWTKEQLNPSACDFFADMPLRMEGDGFVCAHGELAMPGRFGYIYEAQDAIESFTSNQSPMMFVGHTHFPAKFVLDTSNNSVRKDTPTDSFLLPNERYLINAGSVGDPRDGNITASYCIYDTDSSMVRFRQVPFEIEKFRQSLEAVKLPVSPFFIRVYDGLQSETETIKDMKVMESNQTTEATAGTQRVIRVGEDVKTRRKQLNFSMDDVRSTRHLKAQEATRREAETDAKKKGKKVVLGLLAALFVVFAIVIAVVKSGQEEDDTTTIVDKSPDLVEVKVDTVIQEDGKDLILTSARADLPVDTVLDEATGVLMGWTKHASQLKWNARIKNKGWYELFIEHAKTDADSELRLKMAGENYDVIVPATLEGSLEKKPLGYFEIKSTGDMWIYLIALKPGPESVTGLKSISLRYHGDQKPNPYGDLADIVFEDFSSPHFSSEWVIKGEAFPHRPLSKETISPYMPVKGVSGDYCAGSINDAFESKDEVIKAKGTMVSKKFIIKHRYIHMLARGGSGTTISLSIKGKDAVSIKPLDSWPVQLKSHSFDVTEFLGKEACLVFRDFGDKNLVFDNIVFSNEEVADFPSSSNELKKEIPKVVTNSGSAAVARAGRLFIQGNIDEAIQSLASGSSVEGSPGTVNSGSYKNERLKFSEMKMSSKKKLSQLESSNIAVRSCNDKEVFTLKGKFQSAQDLLYLQLDAIADKNRSVGFSRNGNFFLSGVHFTVTRSEIMNKGRYVRISLAGEKTLSLAEVQVFSGGENIAKGKAAGQSSVTHAAPAARAVDGNTDGDFSNKSVTHTDNENNPWWEVDLGKVEAIEKIIVYNRTKEEQARLNRYSISILDENRKAIWHGFVHEAKEKHEHIVTESFRMNFDFAKATYSNGGNTPSGSIHSKNPEAGWSVYSKAKETQKAWFGLKLPLLINENDSFQVNLNFQSGHKKHVMRKFRLTTLSEDKEKLEETEKKFSSFLNFKDAILNTFVEDVGKKIDLVVKATGKTVKIPILGVKEGKIFYARTKYLNYEMLSEQELEKRAKRLEDGELVWAYHRGGLAGKVKDLTYDKSTFIGKLIEAGSKPFIKTHNPLVLTGRFIEIWRLENEKKPEFALNIDSAGAKVQRVAKAVKFKDLYPDSSIGGNFDVSVFDLRVDRNINSFKVVKKSDGKVSKFVVVIKNAAKEIVWQNSWYLSNIFDNGGMTFDLGGVYRQKTEINLAKGAKVIKGETQEGWNGLTDGITGNINPFAYSAAGKAPQEIILDLGEEKTVNAFRAFKALSSAFNGIQVAYSTDNENYTALGAVGTANLSREVVLWTMEEKQVRYVKIKFINIFSTFKHHWYKDNCILSEFQVLKF